MIACALPLALLAAPAGAQPPTGPLTVTSRMLVEHRRAAADGTVRVDTVDATRAVPGDRLIVTLAYRNTGRDPIANVVLANPVARQLAYRGPAPGSPAPELSIDGRHFAPLATLQAAAADGGHRPAGVDDVVAVRWRLPAPVAPGAGGTLGFVAVLK